MTKAVNYQKLAVLGQKSETKDVNSTISPKTANNKYMADLVAAFGRPTTGREWRENVETQGHSKRASVNSVMAGPMILEDGHALDVKLLVWGSKEEKRPLIERVLLCAWIKLSDSKFLPRESGLQNGGTNTSE
jgi:hypothetical protein